MVCRETKVGSAMTSYVKISDGLEEYQSLSLYHELMAEAPRNAVAPQAATRADFADDMIAKVQASRSFTQRRKQSLVERLTAARTAPVAGDVFYATQRIEERSRLAKVALDDYYDRTARSLGCTVGEVRARLRASYEESKRERTLSAPGEWADTFRSRPGQVHLPMDRHTAYAMWRIDTEVAERQEAAETTPIITGHTRVENPVLSAVGYDAATRRLEIEVRSRPGHMQAYQNVTPTTYEAMMASEDPGAYYRRHIAGSAAHAYPTVADANEAGVVRRCASCGQFADSAHNCPPHGSAREEANTVERVRLQQRVLRARSAVASGTREERIAAYAAVDGTSFNRATEMVDEEDRVAALSPDTAMRHRQNQHLVARIQPYRGDSGIFRVTALSTVRFILDEEPQADLPVWARITRVEDPDRGAVEVSPGVVTGRVLATRISGHTSRRDGVYEIGHHTEREQILQCTCAAYRRNYRCEHVDQVMRDMNQRINQDDLRRRHQIAAAQAEVEAQAQVEHAEHLTAQDRAQRRRAAGLSAPDAGPDYSANTAAFQADYTAAMAQVAAGENPMTYMRENATGGLGARDGGRAFGVEIEFDFDRGMAWEDRQVAIDNIGLELYEAGLARTSRQERHMASSARGYTENHQGGWVFENDGSVVGEVVSPIMYDEPETWANLEKVCDIIKRNGGKPTVGSGGHVHVSTGDYDHDVATYNRMLSMYNEYEDVLTRLATNPERGTHRSTHGYNWAVPNPVHPRGYNSTQAAVQANVGRAINMGDMHAGSVSDHAEFRMWDATLEPEAIQGHIKMSLALTEAAVRDSNVQPGPPQPTGTSRRASTEARAGARRLTGEQWRESTTTFRRFVDTMFTRDVDKKQMTALFARTKWQRMA